MLRSELPCSRSQPHPERFIRLSSFTMKTPTKKLTTAAAKKQLTKARYEQNQLAKQILALRTFLQVKGIDPALRKDYTKRNNKIYEQWLRGNSFTAIAKKFDLTATRISYICKRVKLQQSKLKLKPSVLKARYPRAK